MISSSSLVWNRSEMPLFNELQTQAYMRNPIPQLNAMRNQGALVRVKIPILGKVWLTTTQKAASEVLKSNDTFSMRKADGRVAGLSWWMPRSLGRLTHNMLSSDEPEHTRLRRHVDAAFHRRAVLDLEDRITRQATRLIDPLAVPNVAVDLIPTFARPFPLAVISEVLGLPEADRPKFASWAQGLTTVRGVVSFIWAIRQLKPLTRYLEARINQERAQGGHGLIAELIKPNPETEPLSEDELLAMVFLLLLAGHETTTHLISGSVLALLQHPEQMALLQADWSRLDLAVEECLRFVSPVQTAKPRYVIQDCQIQGIALKKGDLVMPFLAAANFDPALFDAPERFDITRKPNHHIEFGAGIHFCLGHQLARLELKIALKALLSRFPQLKLAVRSEEIEWNSRFGLRSLKSLPIRP